MTHLSEHDMQASIFAEADLRANQDARWLMLMAIPNGQYRPGQRMEPGLRPGAPDIVWYLKAHGYIGLALELKVGRNKPTPTQNEWLAWLASQGWYTGVVYDDPQTVVDLLEWYLSGAEVGG